MINFTKIPQVVVKNFIYNLGPGNGQEIYNIRNCEGNFHAETHDMRNSARNTFYFGEG